jgi:hypothetical protein
MSRLARWANAVASADTRAIAPPSTRSCATDSGAVEARRYSRIVPATCSSTVSMNMLWPTAVGWKSASSGG